VLKFLGFLAGNFCGHLLVFPLIFLAQSRTGALAAAALCMAALIAATTLGRRIQERDFRRGFRPMVMIWSLVYYALAMVVAFKVY
jgi:uncharacterized membrane protein (UPF0136 family)